MAWMDASPLASRGKARRGAIAAALVAAAISFPPAAAHAATCPDGVNQFVSQAGRDFIAASRTESSSAFGGVMSKHADMQAIALFALGKYQKDMPAARRSEYVALVRSFVAGTLADFSRKFRGDSIEVTNCRDEGNGVFVESTMRFLGGKPAQQVQWRLHGSGSYRIFDVNVQNVWLAILLRSAITSEIEKRKGIDGLFAYLNGSGERVTGN